jgi:DNA helicase-2/ATP-dependent DNA helicase PcrA
MINSNLNKDQQKVLEYKDGPVLVIAGPGSGKTKTLVERVAYLIQQGVAAESIMVATFTDKAAKELQTRISNRLLELDMKANLKEMYLGTLHSIFLRILEENSEYTRLKRNYRLLDPFDQAYYIYRNFWTFLKEVPDLGLLVGEYGSYWKRAQKLLKYINVVSEEVLDIEQLKSSGEPEIEAIANSYMVYEHILEEENAIDFSSIQTETLRLLQENDVVLNKLQDKIQYFMVDEYQDTNTVQEMIMLLLSGKNHNLCVVGDDDQGLYRFRGATIRNILEFEQNYKAGECRKVILSTNYRSHPDIIKFYNEWMQNQNWMHDGKKFRYDKSIVPCERLFPDTAGVIRVSSDGDANDYHEEVLKFIKELHDKQVISDYNQIAFLFRSVQSDKVISLSRYLEEHGIKVFSPRSNLFFDREEVRLLLGALVYIFPTEDDVFSEYNQYVEVFQTLAQEFEDALQKNPVENKFIILWVAKKMNELCNLKHNTNYSFTDLIYELLQFPMFSKFLDVDLESNKTDLRPAYNIGVLTQLLSKFEYLYNVTVFTPKNINKTLKHLFNEYLNFIMDGGINEYENFDETTPSGCISFMTIHQSKGLEFPITVVGSMHGIPRKTYNNVDILLQNKFYRKQMYEPIEETKFYDLYRLYYTAFSRAQNLLVITGNEHSGASSIPSKYLRSVWNAAPDWKDSSVFDMTKLNIADVHPVNIKHNYSFTGHVLLYESCPLKYKFYKELEFAEVRKGAFVGGSLLHETIEDIHRAVLRGEENTLTNDNITSWFNKNYTLLVKLQHTFLQQAQQDAILKQVLRYRDNNSSRWNQIKEAEVDVSLVKEDYILEGKIDLVRGENGTVELVDFKSGDKPDVNTKDEFKKATLNQYRRQLEVYAYLIEQTTGEKVSKMNLYYPKEESGNPQISFPYRSSNIEATIHSFDEVVDKIEKKDFSMKCVRRSEKQCKECDMRFYCNNK